MVGWKNFFAGRWGIVAVGIVIGILAPLHEALDASAFTGPAWCSMSGLKSSASSSGLFSPP